MVKHTISLSVDEEIIFKLKKIAEENNMKISEIGSKVLETGFRYGEPIKVKCPICSNEYLNKEGFCPKCKEEIMQREIQIQNDMQLESLNHRLDKLMEWKSKGAFVSDNEIKAIKDKIDIIKNPKAE